MKKAVRRRKKNKELNARCHKIMEKPEAKRTEEEKKFLTKHLPW